MGWFAGLSALYREALSILIETLPQELGWDLNNERSSK